MTYVGASAICVPTLRSAIVNKTLDVFTDVNSGGKAGIMAVISYSYSSAYDAAISERNSTVLGLLDSWRMKATYGGLEILSPINAKNTIRVSEILHDIYIRYVGHNRVGPWAGFIDPDVASWSVPNKVISDYGQEGRTKFGDQLVKAGINPWITDTADGILQGGNKTLYRANSLLQFENIANYFLMLERELPALVASARRKGKPNTPEGFKAIYEVLKPYFDGHKKASAIFDYNYNGDQFITDISQAVVNTPEIVNAGNHVFKLAIYPTNILIAVQAQIVVVGNTAQLSIINND
jgi:hypothetical protein